jgi:RNA polymerase sigma-70 factor (ECF subfamily)
MLLVAFTTSGFNPISLFFSGTIFLCPIFAPSPEEGIAEKDRMDQQAEFLTLFLQHQADCKAFIGSVVRDRHARDDIFQEVALLLWKKFAEYDPRFSFGAWARGIAAKKIMQQWEKVGKLPLPQAPQVIQTLLDAFERTETSASAEIEALEHCLELLPEKSRQLLALRYEESLSLNQIAQRVQSTLDAVHKALSRLRARLQECVDQRLAAAGETHS